jgi:dTDP-4-dehydrorhamnose reductase
MAKNKILIFGASGMIGSELATLLACDYELLTPGKKEVDITSFESILQFVSEYELEAIINAAAYTNVDLAEDEWMEENFLVNAWWAANIARVASIFDIPYITYSTNYVFDGTRNEPYLPSDIPHPIGNYGMAKYLAEKMVQREYSDAIIIRTGILYGGDMWTRKHLIWALYKNIKIGEVFKVVSDQIMIPTFSSDLVQATKEVLKKKDEYFWSILHLTNRSDTGGISPYDVALQLLDFMRASNMIEPISMKEYASKTKRPKNSVLENTSDIILPDWKDSLKKYIDYVQS